MDLNDSPPPGVNGGLRLVRIPVLIKTLWKEILLITFNPNFTFTYLSTLYIYLYPYLTIVKQKDFAETISSKNSHTSTNVKLIIIHTLRETIVNKSDLGEK